MPNSTDFDAFLRSFQSGKFQGLRGAQAFVLDQYNNFLGANDVGVELPTGAGKTLIALLVAELWRRDYRKVAILSANKTLARQMVSEATALGVPAVLMEGAGRDIPGVDKRAYQRAQSIAVMNYWVYFNQNPVIDPADLLVMDDAHLAEHCLHSLYSVEIDKHRHSALFESLMAELGVRYPEYGVIADALAQDTPSISPAELLSFLDHVAVAGRIREIIDSSPALQSDTDLRFRWTRLRQRLNEANIYVSLKSLWIRPYVYPLIANDHYRNVQQRLYVSATIGDTGDLSRRLGTSPIEKIPVLPEHAQQTYGRRLIVMNRIEDADIPERLQLVILAALRVHAKSVWLCASQAEATRVREVVLKWLNANGLVGHPSWILTSLGGEIDDFKRAPQGHLIVGGRFDGMDFSAEECRLVVVKTLPRAVNIQEEFISAYLRDSGFMRRRLNQRIVQALGRCNRAEDDYGVYVLADKRFATHFGRESNRQGIPGNMIAEIDMAQDHAEIEQTDLVAGVDRFLRGDFLNFDEDYRRYREQVPDEEPVPQAPDTSAYEVSGWSALFGSQNYSVAADRFEAAWERTRAANVVEMGAFHGWNHAKALHLQSLLGDMNAGERALQALDAAVARGGGSSWFNRLRASLNRARQEPPTAVQAGADYATVLIRAFDDQLERLGTRGNRFERYCQSVTDGLHADTHDRFCETLEKLGGLLGYAASRPRYQAAPDCRWRGVFGNRRELVTFEAKVEQVARVSVVPADVGQAHNQLARAEGEYGAQGYVIRGVIVTHLDAIDDAAEAAAGAIRIVARSTVLDLWNRVRLLFGLYRDHWSLDDVRMRTGAIARIQDRIPRTGWLQRALDHQERFVGSEQLLLEWR